MVGEHLPRSEETAALYRAHWVCIGDYADSESNGRSCMVLHENHRGVCSGYRVLHGYLGRSVPNLPTGRKISVRAAGD